LPEQFILN